VFIPEPEPFPKKIPEMEQLKLLEDSTTFGLWINDRRVKNSVLKSYTNTDFALLVYSKLEKNAINYGKHFYQVNLMTNEYYANYVSQYELREKYFICARKKKEDAKSKIGNEIDANANLRAVDSIQTKLYVVDGIITDQRRAKYFMEVGVESITVLNGKDATYKYGEKGKNGVFEITLKKQNVKESESKTTENMVSGKVTDNSGKPSDDASCIVTGKVTLSDGRPLQRVPVRIKGSNTRTLTDKDGLFSMADVPKDCMLEFQNVGLMSITAKPDFEKPMNVKMELGSFWIDRVKVISQANDNNPPKPLPKHGFASNMSATPLLFVLDGVIVDKTTMDQIEPDDIKSVRILNAKSATEKYGQLAKNGVMEIQSKGKVNLSARNGHVVVEVNEYADNQNMELHNNNIIDEMPEFKGGMKGLMQFISGSIKYPDQAIADKVQGNVEVNFVIGRDGKVENVMVAKEVNPSLDAEAIRMISSMPDWNPGKQRGESVAVSFTIPIQFAIK
jgi:TonB family protein